MENQEDEEDQSTISNETFENVDEQHSDKRNVVLNEEKILPEPSIYQGVF